MFFLRWTTAFRQTRGSALLVYRGYCRDNADANPWAADQACVELEASKAKCVGCAGIAWSATPPGAASGCRDAGLPRCGVYIGDLNVSLTWRRADEGSKQTHFCSHDV